LPAGGTPASCRRGSDDRPFPLAFISEATVTITQVAVREGEPLGDNDETGNEGQDTSGFITIFDDSQGQAFDLLTLRNGQMQLLVSATVPAGHYNQMRLVISSGQIKLTNGETFDLTVPSGAASGLKLNADFNVVKDQITELVMEFDLTRAFETIPNNEVTDISQIQGFTFSPTLEGAIRVVLSAETGAISGTVTGLGEGNPPVAGALVTAINNADTELAGTVTDENGNYVLTGLPPGSYTVRFSVAGSQATEVVGVVVAAGEVTDGVDALLPVE
jgi:hypothetical protein